MPFRIKCASRDHHPPDHISFVTEYPGKRVFESIKTTHPDVPGKEIEQILWPVIPLPFRILSHPRRQAFSKYSNFGFAFISQFHLSVTTVLATFMNLATCLPFQLLQSRYIVSVVQKEQNSYQIWTLRISTSLYKRARKNLWNHIPHLRIPGDYSLVPWNSLFATLESKTSLSRDWVCFLEPLSSLLA